MDSVLIYQMGKVGSAAIRDSLNEIGVSNFQVHYLQETAVDNLTKRHFEMGMKIPPHLERSREVISNQLLNNGEVRIITLIRDPVARNVSAFFQNIDSYFPKGTWKKVPSEDLIKTFIEKYPHKVSINWFENEFCKTLGFSIYEEDVAASNGIFYFGHSNFKVLMIKVESDDSSKEKAINDFLDLNGKFKLLKTNIGEEKNYSDAYKEFKSKIVLPDDYIDALYTSKLIKTFYSEKEILKFRKKWRS